ncbi:hypothetical protein AAVH_02340 [Aphelenchoides avenae]|nr:hypothetical protein AAVH_02340 [Aphelenchus avenae]
MEIDLPPYCGRSLAFKKGTLLLRVADITSSSGTFTDDIWRVDNGKLLQKFEFCEALPTRVAVYRRTNRYIGWLCTHSWEYIPLDFEGDGSNGNRVFVSYPSPEQLKQMVDEKNAERVLLAARVQPIHVQDSLPAYDDEQSAAVASILSED